MDKRFSSPIKRPYRRWAPLGLLVTEKQSEGGVGLTEQVLTGEGMADRAGVNRRGNG